MGRAQGNILARASHDLNQSFASVLDALPLEVLEEGRVVAAPIDEGVRDSCAGQGIEEHGGSSVHLRRSNRISTTDTERCG